MSKKGEEKEDNKAVRQPLARSCFEFQASLSGRTKLVLLLLSWSLFFSFWQFFPRSEGMERLIPTASETFAAVQSLLVEERFIEDVWASLKRIGISFVIAVAIALPLGILMGSFPVVAGFFSPIVSPFRYLPAPSFIPFLLVLLGTGDGQKIALLVIGVVWFLISLLMEDARRVPKELVEASRTLGCSRMRAVRSVIIPSALPQFVDTMRQMLAVSWTYLVIAEIVASTDGIGAVMMRARRVVDMDTVFACILTIGVLGFFSDALIRGLRWVAFPYLRNFR